MDDEIPDEASGGEEVESSFAHDEQLFLAVGRVAVESALLEDFLRELLDEMVPGDVTWRIWQGQTTEWLVQTCKSILEETDPWVRRYTREHHARFGQLLGHIGELRELRNTVVHGVWAKHAVTEDAVRPRPWGSSEDEEKVYIVLRSRYRRVFVEQEFTIGDMNKLAEELQGVYRALAALYREMKNDAELFPRW